MTILPTPPQVHSELHALLRACKLDPFDDARRLVLADWLEDRGESERAEFVRTQLRLAQLAWYEPEVPELEARQAELLRRHADEWLAGPRSLGLPGCSFQRGLVVTEGPPEDFRPALGGPGPGGEGALAWVDTLAARPRDPHAYEHSTAEWEQLFASPLLGHVARLLLDMPRLDGPYQALARAPHGAGVRDLALVGGSTGMRGLDVGELARGTLEGIRQLHVNLNTILDEEKAALLAPPHFPHLERVSLAGMGGVGERTAAALVARTTPLRALRLLSYALSGAALADLLSRPHLAGVTDLHLRWRTDGARRPAEEQVLARTAHLTRVRSLRVYGEIRGVEVSGLAAASLLAGVRELDLSGARLGPEELRLLLESPHLGGLEVLGLHINNLGDEGAEALASTPTLAGLRVLILSANGIKPRGVEALARSPHLAGLQVLDLSGNPLGPQGWAALAGSPHWRNLRTLNLGDTRPRLAGVKALAGSPVLGAVRRLILWGNSLSAGHLRALLRSPHLGPLTGLNLCRNRIDAAAARVLAGSPKLAGLRALDVTINWVDEEGAAALVGSPHLRRLALLGPTYGLTDPAQQALAEAFGRDVRELVFDERLYHRDD